MFEGYLTVYGKSIIVMGHSLSIWIIQTLVIGLCVCVCVCVCVFDIWLFLSHDYLETTRSRNEEVRPRSLRNACQYMSDVSVGGYGNVQQGQNSMLNDNVK